MKTLLLVACALCLTSARADLAWKSSNPRVQQHIDQGALLEKRKDLKGAREQYEAILRLEPRNAMAMNAIGGLSGLAGDFHSELAWSAKAIAVDSKFWMAFLNQGTALMQLGRLQEARTSYEKARALAPKSPLPYYALGNFEETQGKVKEALDWYRKSTEVDPGYEAGHFNTAAMLANLGKFKEAKASLRRVIEINPNAEDAREMLRQIEAELAKTSRSRQ